MGLDDRGGEVGALRALVSRTRSSAGSEPSLWTTVLGAKAEPALGQAPAVWKSRPTRNPTAAAPRPMATILAPLLRQSPTSVTAE